MKVVVWKEPGGITVEDMPVPEKKPEESLIKVIYAGICGSDLTIVAGKHPRARPPLVPGHEFVGIVEALPDGYGGPIRVGQRVAVNPLVSCRRCAPCLKGKEHICENLKLLGIERNPGAFAEYATVPQVERLFLTPDTMPAQIAALMEPLAVAVHSVELSGIKPYESAVIIGAGPIGLLIAEVAKAFGVSEILICEVSETRLERARSMGFNAIDSGGDNTEEAILQAFRGKRPDVTFEAAGVPAAAQLALAITGIDGRIVMTAIHKKPAEMMFQQLVYREQKIIGTRIYSTDDFAKAIFMAETRAANLEPLITHVFSLEKAQEAFDVSASGADSCKILLRP